MKAKTTSKTVSNLEGKYAIVICVITMLIALISTGMIVSGVIEILAMPQAAASADKWTQHREYSSLIGSGTFLVVSLFAFAFHRPMLNNDR